MQSSVREKMYFTTQLALDEFLKGLPDIPKNKKLREVTLHFISIFRDKWYEAKAEDDLKYWKEAKRQAILVLRDKVLSKRKKKKRNRINPSKRSPK